VYGLALWAISDISRNVIKRIRSKSQSQQEKTDKRNWKPWPMKIRFLNVVLASTVVLIIVIRMLWHISSLTDSDRSSKSSLSCLAMENHVVYEFHLLTWLGWSGGLESAGTWQGEPYYSAFTPAPGEGRPIRGLVSFYLDVGTSGTYARKDASQRMGVPIYILWTYIPSVVAVMYGVLWTILDGELKRIEKFHQLTSPNGSSGKSSICLDYHCFWTPMAIIQAIRFRQWTVVFSSIGCVVAVIAVPNIQNYVFNWAVYAGGDLYWGGIYSWQVGYVDPYWAKVMISVLAVDLVCILGVIVLVHCRQSGLEEDPKGIISWVKLTVDICNESAFGLESDDSFAKSSEIYSKLKHKRFQILSDTAQVLQMLPEVPQPSRGRVPVPWRKLVPHPLRNILAKIQAACKGFAKFVLHVNQRVQSVTEYANNIFSPVILVPWIAWLILSLCANIYILAKMTTSEQLTLKNYALPWSPNIYLVVGVLIQVRRNIYAEMEPVLHHELTDHIIHIVYIPSLRAQRPCNCHPRYPPPRLSAPRNSLGRLH
jgi:hypothetical protein